ncbi:MAG: hypothetical protein IT384_04515 [Deltaproteobacteria bacterium]|nr:hypothetical protein [Deltaproteobacteria bacterium]
MAGKKQRLREEREALTDLARPDAAGSMARVRGQLRTAARIALIALAVIWLLALGFWSGLDSLIPIYVAAVLTLAGAIGTALILRNLKKSEELGSLLGGGDDLSEEDRAARLQKLEAQVEKGDAAAIIAKAQLLMQAQPRDALATLEKVDLAKAQKLIAGQVRTMRAMIHLNLGDVKAARDLVEELDLSKAPDPKSRASFAAVQAEAWARSGNPIEASELLDKYDPEDKDFAEIRIQLLRARVFACAHRQDVNGMRRALKAVMAVSPQLAAMFIGQKRIHPLLEKEARRALEKSGLAPRLKVQFQRR